MGQVIRETEYTKVKVWDEPGQGNACHAYSVGKLNENEPYMTRVDFQNGPIQENGVNGCQNEDLLVIVIHRLQGFQSGQFKCRENAIALTKILEALMWLDKRTSERTSRGVEGKNMA